MSKSDLIGEGIISIIAFLLFLGFMQGVSNYNTNAADVDEIEGSFLDKYDENDIQDLTPDYFRNIDNEHNDDKSGFKTIGIIGKGNLTIFDGSEMPSPFFWIDIDIDRGERVDGDSSFTGGRDYEFQVTLYIKYNENFDRSGSSYDLQFIKFEIVYVLLKNDDKIEFNTERFTPSIQDQSLNSTTQFYVNGYYEAPIGYAGRILVYLVMVIIAIAILYSLRNFSVSGRRKSFGQKSGGFEDMVKGIIILITLPIWGTYYLLKWYFVDRKKPKISDEQLYDEDHTLGDESLEEAILMNGKAMKDIETNRSLVIEISKNEKQTISYEDLEECCKYAYRLNDKYCGVCGKVIQYDKLPPKE